MTRARRMSVRPGWFFRSVRRGTQVLTLVAIVLGPFLGGWQRVDRSLVAQWAPSESSRLFSLLPAGRAAAWAYDANVLKGGGSGVDYFAIPVADPAGGLLSLLTLGELSFRTVVAWTIPLFIALVAGRVFCGWFCPFGTVTRLLEALVERLPFQPPRLALPSSRPVRLVVLVLGLGLGAFGAQFVLYLFLPYVLLQQSVYGLLLLGGGGAALGAFGGLLLVGVVAGPSVYCAAVCPTGAALALAGHARVVRLRILEPARCGAHCDLCSRACWLDLEPHTGDAGPDCDVCARCVAVCPKDNLRVGLTWPRLRARLPVRAALLLAVAAAPVPADAQVDALRAEDRPKLLFEAHEMRQGIDIKIAAVDVAGVHLDADDLHEERGVVLNVYLARGPTGEVDERGRMGPRAQVYGGPLRLTVVGGGGHVKHEATFEEPNAPISAPRRSVYRWRAPLELEAGDRLVLASIPGWLASSESFSVPETSPFGGRLRGLGFFFVALLVFGGAVLIAAWVRPTTG